MIDAASYGLSTSNSSLQNRVALSDAIRAAGGNTVYVDAGTYAIDPLRIETDNTHLQFAPGTILQVAPDTLLHPSILDIRASHVTVEGGQFDGSSVAGISGIMAIRIFGSCSHIAIRNCTVRNASVGIGAYNGANCYDWEISGCIIDDTVKGHGIYLHGHPRDNASVTSVHVHSNTIGTAAGNGIWIGNGFCDVTISGNQIFSSGRMGIEVWRNPTGRFVIANNIINTCTLFGISISETPHTVCSGNIITNATSYGIEVAASRSVSLIGNQIESVLPKEGGSKPTGIALNSKDNGALGDITITGGIISDCYSGINMCGDGGLRDTIAIHGVIIRGCTVGIHNVGKIGARDGGGIAEHLAVTGCIINCNSVGIGNSLYGGVMRGGVITGNDITVGDGNGIDLFKPTNVTLANNRVTGTSAPSSIGIRLRDNPTGNAKPHNLQLSGNAVTGFVTPIKVLRIYNSTVEHTLPSVGVSSVH